MAKRTDNHDGSCREILNGKHAGKWRVQFTVVSDAGLKKRVSRVLPNKTEARECLRQLRHGNVVIQSRSQREMTFGEWFDWLGENDWPESIAPVTIAQRKSRFKNYSKSHFGNVPLSKIDAVQVRAFYKWLRANGASANLVMMVKSDLVRAFNQAITPYQRVPTSLANPFRLAVPRPDPRQAVALTPQEIKKALASDSLNLSERAFLGLFLLAGLRLGEAMAITCGQILLEENLISIDRAVRVAYGGKQTVGLPKGDKIRQAVLCKKLRGLIEPYIAGMSPESLLWPATSENKPKMKKRFYELWREAAKKAGLPIDLSPHDCRLSHINIIEKLMPKVSVTTLKEHVGHAADGVTEVNYTRPLTPPQKILRSEIDRVFG